MLSLLHQEVLFHSPVSGWHSRSSLVATEQLMSSTLTFTVLPSLRCRGEIHVILMTSDFSCNRRSSRYKDWMQCTRKFSRRWETALMHSLIPRASQNVMQPCVNCFEIHKIVR